MIAAKFREACTCSCLNIPEVMLASLTAYIYMHWATCIRMKPVLKVGQMNDDHVQFVFLEELLCCYRCCSGSSVRGCHSHRLYSHSCDRRSQLWPALFSSLTVDHAKFWPLIFDNSDILPAKKSRYLNCNPSPWACMLGNKGSAHV